MTKVVDGNNVISRFASALATIVLLSACHSASEPKPVAAPQAAAPPAASEATTKATEDAGPSVRSAASPTVEGVAQNAKAGAVLETTNGVPVYIHGLNEWPPKVVGKRLRASGRLRTIHHPDPCPRPDETCMAGISGDQRILEDATFTDESGAPIVVRP